MANVNTRKGVIGILTGSVEHNFLFRIPRKGDSSSHG